MKTLVEVKTPEGLIEQSTYWVNLALYPTEADRVAFIIDALIYDNATLVRVISETKD